MPSIEQLVQQSLNPFDPTTFRPGNFWKETQDENQEVSSIHQEVLDRVEQTLDLLLRDRKTRTLMLQGDAGSGKSYLLGRLKRRLNDKACFAYVGPWPDSQFIWRHILRQTVDSLLETPPGQEDPQLIHWLKGLEVLKKGGLAKLLMGERSVFVSDMRASFRSGLYQPKEFFGVLYELLDPKTRMVASDWLRGEDLDDGDLRTLKVKRSLDSEDAAQKMLGNFGKIADSTQPIVICFDNLDNIPKKADGKPDLQALFDVNSTIHNEKLSNFLILVSIITSNWRENRGAIAHADRDRIDDELTLRLINLDEAEAIWASRLQPLHAEAHPKPSSRIAPLTRQWLEQKYPGGKVAPREALILAEELIRIFKKEGTLPDSIEKDINEPTNDISDEKYVAGFELTWQKEFRETGQQLSRIAQFSSPELARRLQEALEALATPELRSGVLPSPTYKSYSLAHRKEGLKAGIVWTEDASLTSFCNVMKACQKMLDKGICTRLYLIRAANLGTHKNRGYQLFQEIFDGNNRIHIKTDLESVQYLETYHRLVNAAASRELVIASQTPDIAQLQALIRESDVLTGCKLLQTLGVVAIEESESKTTEHVGPDSADIEAARKYILNLMATQSMMGMQAVMSSAEERVPSLESEDMQRVIYDLCDAQKIQMLDPNASLEAQLLCYVPA
ncbi:MAG: KAP family P-loop domain-containing protein [Leptolyngbya foveolarum]|uniref:KAP family P-loop domain-containing protein n=1 Tax=Leptolyngbya foveolarum TaxID=47253 RepID=A0A2W4UQT2_9CYAN|nr:MAG: KAP family P-loop domain-containing protein [Leptolyngbya foveolarum]